MNEKLPKVIFILSCIFCCVVIYSSINYVRISKQNNQGTEITNSVYASYNEEMWTNTQTWWYESRSEENRLPTTGDPNKQTEKNRWSAEIKGENKSNIQSTTITYRVNKDWQAKLLPDIELTDKMSIDSRLSKFLRYYWYWIKLRWDNSMNIKTEVIVCIARADSHIWYALKGKNNVGNVWNNDRWDVVNYATLDDGIRAIARTLNNRYLWNKKTIWDLSGAWYCTTDCGKLYATSKENWNNNVLNCLSFIHQKQINPDFLFRK